MTVSDVYRPPLFRYLPEVSAFFLFLIGNYVELQRTILSFLSFFIHNFQYCADDGMDRQSLQNTSTSYFKTRVALHGNVSS